MFSCNIQSFITKFPTSVELLSSFHPDNWGVFLENKERCMTSTDVCLNMLEEHYGLGTIKELVVQQFIGLHNLSAPRDFNEKAIRMAAGMFLAQYAANLTPYGLVLYFAEYPTKYKIAWSMFDLQDILKQCGRFIQWWQSKMPETPENEQQPATRGISLREMMRVWINEGRSDKDFHENSGLYRCGAISDALIRQARKEVSNGIF